MNRILLDEGLAPLAAEILRHNGFDAVHVSDMEWNGPTTSIFWNWLDSIEECASPWTTISTDTLRLPDRGARR